MHLNKKHFKIKHFWHWIVGFLAFLWVLLRSGTNPKRLTYPCQRAAMPFALNWLLAVIAFFGGSLLLRRYAKFCGIAILIVGVVWFIGTSPQFTRSEVSSIMSLPVWEVYDPISKVFVMDSIPPTSGSLAAGDSTVPEEYLSDPAIDTMLAMMETQDIYLHKTAICSSGIVGADDIVIIKGNFQWTSRNTTSTDRIKGVIWQILNHPDGFSGEILVCDNTQDIGTGINQDDNNSEDTAQSIPDVVNTFYDKGYPVYYLDWNFIWYAVTSEYSDGDYDDGYIYESSTKISYPKFRSPSNNYYISLRYGVWDSVLAAYDSSRLCIIDFPVLKAHSWAGATIAVKNWIGVLTTAHSFQRYGGISQMHDNYFFGTYALVARVMAVTHPKLTIVDAAWTTTEGPVNLIEVQNTNMLLVSTDPVASSWYAAKFILTPIARYPYNTNPDNPGGTYNINLSAWKTFLSDSAGFPCTKDSSEISVYDRTIFLPQFTRVYDGDAASDSGFSFSVTWVDYDNDDYLDLFVTNWYDDNQLNYLYHNNGDGTFTKITGDTIVSEGRSLGSSWGDFDNDGDLDAYVANPGPGGIGSGANNYFYLNNGNGTFTKVTDGVIVSEVEFSMSPAWADYDNDGYLDLFVTNHCVPPCAGGVENSLFRNDEGQFSKMSNSTIGLDEDHGNSANWVDYDNDGDLDLWLTRNEMNNAFFENNGDGTFTELTSGVLIADTTGGGSWADYDNDGNLDLFVTNYDFHNFLYQNLGGGNFIKVSDLAIVSDTGRWTGSCWGDYDNDGDLDLYVTGHSYYTPHLNAFYENNGDGTFSKITEGELATDLESSSGVACGDFDRDGDLDLFVANLNYESNALYKNNGNSNSWINIKCIGTISNRSAIGAKVRVKATTAVSPVWQLREISGQTGHFGQNSLNAHFGLGYAAVVDSIKVEWPSGWVYVLTDIDVNQFLTITEVLCGDANGDVDINLSDPICLANYYFGKPCRIVPEASDVNCDTNTNLADALIIGKYYFGIPGFDLNCCE